MVYNPVCINDSMVPEIIKHLRESQFHVVKIISIDTKQVSGYRYVTLQKKVYNKRCRRVGTECMRNSRLMLNLFFAMFHFHLCGDIQDIFPAFAHDFQTASSIAYNADQINEHLSDKALLNTDLDIYKLEEEEEEQYSLIDEMQRRTETDPDLVREYEALGGYLSSDSSDVEPITTCCKWEGMCLWEPFFLTNYNGDENLL
uniref:Uncharacterized protein n=1 Tax=Romanomermis culicivorax TaxID=13658 RepID=A0A915I8V2_ROMCU